MTHRSLPEDLQSEIAAQRAALASTIDQMRDRLDVRTRAHDIAADLKDRATTDNGKPKPAVVGGTVGASGLMGLGLWVLSHYGRHPIRKAAMLAGAGGVGYAMGQRHHSHHAHSVAL